MGEVTEMRPREGRGYRLGLLKDEETRRYVRALAEVGTPFKEICRILGEQYRLAKPLSMDSLYRNFGDLLPKTPVRVRMAPSPQEVSAQLEELRRRYTKSASPAGEDQAGVGSILEGIRAKRSGNGSMSR